MTYRNAAVLAALATALIAWPAIAGFRQGDIIVAGAIPPPSYPGPFTAKLRQFAPDGTLIQEFYSNYGGTVDLKFSPGGILHTAAGVFIFRFASDYSQLSSIPAISGFNEMHSMAFARSGDLFVTTRSGAVMTFDANGVAKRVDVLDTVASDWADLGLDQCTLYYFRVPAPPIGRFDVCTHTVLSPLATPTGIGGLTLLALADGTLLATSPTGAMDLLRSDGTVLRHYNTVAVAWGRDPDPRYVWVSYGSQVARFDLQNDIFAAGPFETGIGVSGIAIVGADAPSSIPALSPIVLALLVLCVSVSAVLRMRV